MNEQKIYIKKGEEGSLIWELKEHTLMLIVYTQKQVKQANEMKELHINGWGWVLQLGIASSYTACLAMD